MVHDSAPAIGRSMFVAAKTVARHSSSSTVSCPRPRITITSVMSMAQLLSVRTPRDFRAQPRGRRGRAVRDGRSARDGYDGSLDAVSVAEVEVVSYREPGA